MDFEVQGSAVNTHAAAPTPIPVVDLSFPHNWQAKILPARPVILPARHFVYPRDAEEVERGALEVLVRPGSSEVNAQNARTREVARSSVKGTGFSPYIHPSNETGALAPEGLSVQESNSASSPQPFLATCALGFRDPAVPAGLWSTPNPDEICTVSGGYAYLIDTAQPERFTMIPYRPVLQILPAPAANLLLFVGHRSILAWGANGQAWESEKLSDEGITSVTIEDGQLHGQSWQMLTDKETPFALDLRTGLRV
jgi:hypothetical protein